MKRNLLILPMILLCLSFILSGCGKTEVRDEKIPVSVDYNNGTSVVRYYEKGDIVDLPENITPEKPYLEFDNWYTDTSFETLFDASQEIHRHTTIYARWKLKENIRHIINLSGSMRVSGFEKGDIIIVNECELSEINTGDFICFYKGSLKINNEEIKTSLYTEKQQNTNDFKIGQTEFDSPLIFHEVIGVYYDVHGHTWFETKGSSNINADSYLVRGDYVHGRYFDKYNNYRWTVEGINKSEINLGGSISFEAYNDIKFDVSNVNCEITGRIEDKESLIDLDKLTFNATGYENDYTSWKHDLNFDSKDNVYKFTVNIKNLSTERSIFATLYSIKSEFLTETLTANEETYKAYSPIEIEAGEEATFVMTLSLTDVTESVDNICYRYSFDLYNTAAS